MRALHDLTPMNPTLQQIIAASLLGGFLSMAIAVLVTFRLPQRWLTRMVSFSAGLLLSIALLDLMPEALKEGMTSDRLFQIFLIGVLLFFAFEKIFLSEHFHGRQGEVEALSRPIPVILFGSALHIWTDGLTLAAAFLTDTKLGWGMTFAIIAHEIPREGGDFSLLFAAGWNHKKALLWNSISRLGCVAGGIMGYFMLEGARSWIAPVLALAAASFTYISLAGLMPWIRSERGGFAWHGVFMAAGVAIVPLSAKMFA